MKRILSIFLCLCLALGLAACGGASSADSTAAAEAGPQAANTMARESTGDVQDAGGAAALGGELSLPAGRKIILNADLTLEATDFPAVCAALRKAAGEAGGYLSASEQSTPAAEDGARWAHFVFRIPAEQYALFLQKAGEAGNVTYQTETTEDITASYVDVEARIHSLEAQRDQLLELLQASGELETLLAIQEQLSDVQYRLESYEGQRRLYDDQVADSTVNVTVREVRYLTQQTETFGQRIAAAFAGGWRTFGATVQNVAVGLVAALPLLLVLALAAVPLALAVRRRRRKKRQSPPQPEKKEGPHES